MKNNLNLEKFNASQREAICHDAGPALVLAGPGSGKTTVITKRLQYLTEILHIPPEEIMVVTFTKAAAREMQQRFELLSQAKLPVRFGTFHAVYYHILKESSEKSLILIKEKEKQEYIRRILRKEHISEAFADSFLKVISRLKSSDISNENIYDSSAWPREVSVENVTPMQVYDIFQKYRQLCREKGKLDFDDMAYECLELLVRRQDILEIWRKRCRYILADEYQDIAPIQERILFMLALPENNLFLVGDDDQSVYGFRGAGTESMLSFPRRYPDTKQIFLEMNYRCRPEIIQAAGKVIAGNKDRFVKRQIPAREKSGKREVCCKGFPDRDAQNEEIIKLLKEMQREGRVSEAAVLFRKGADAEALTGLLNRYRIPCVYTEKTKSIYGHFVTDDVTAYLRLLYGDRTRKNFYRIMNRPDRQLDRDGCGSEIFSFRELMEYHIYDISVINNIRKLEKDCRMACGMKPYAAVMYIRKGMGYENWLRREYSGTAFKECMQALLWVQEAAGRSSDLQEWERNLTEGRQGHKGNGQREGDGKGVRILTYHGSKGLEFDCVIMPDLNEGTVPHKKAVSEKDIEEERRMFYVGMTRARESLYLYYRTGTKEEPETVSRFLKGLIT